MMINPPPLQVTEEMLARRHQLTFVSSSAQPVLGPITREAHWEFVRAAHAAGMTAEQQEQQFQKAKVAAAKEQQKGEHLAQVKLLRVGSEAGKGGSPVVPHQSEIHTPSSILRIARLSGHAVDSCLSLADDEHPAWAGPDFTSGPLSPDIEYSLLLGSMEEMLPDDEEYMQSVSGAAAMGTAKQVMIQQLLGSMDDESEARSALDTIEEEMCRAASRSMSLAHLSVSPGCGGGLDSMASLDDTWPGEEDVAMSAPRPGSARAGATAPIAIPIVSHVTNPRAPMISSSAATQADDQMPGSPQAGQLLTQPEPPAAWFVADDPVTHVRYFVIQV